MMPSDTSGVEMLSVIVPTHNPRAELLPGLFAALAAQTHASARWELVVVDNASFPPLAPDFTPLSARGVPCRLVREDQPGLTYARLAGIAGTRGHLLVFVDDDNLPSSDFLACAAAFAGNHPWCGVFGGRVLPRYATTPPDWFAASGLALGCRDFGDQPLFTPAFPRPVSYPHSAPIGAGMVLRREVARLYVDHVAHHPQAATDRQGRNLSSGGDCEIVLVGLFAGWSVGYAPELRMEHLIPSSRLHPAYLARLNRESSRSWVILLDRFGLNPWPAIHSASVPLRKFRAWFAHRAWRGPLEHIAWSGACGIFEGRASLSTARANIPPS